MNPYQCKGEKQQFKELEIGADVVYYRQDDYRTYLYDEDYRSILTLSWVATEKEILAAFYGYGAGRSQGRHEGIISKINEIKRVLLIEG